MKRFFLAIGMAALMLVSGTNVYLSNQRNEMENNLSLKNIEAEGSWLSDLFTISEGDRARVTYWYEWGENREDGSGWRKKECVIGYAEHSDNCIEGDATSISWGPSGPSTKELDRYYTYGSGINNTRKY